MDYQIRPAIGSDSLTVAEVVKSVFDEYGFTWDEADYCADLYDLENHYLRQGHGFWVAELHGRIVGSVGLCLHPKFEGRVGDMVLTELETRAAGTDCSLERLYVHSSARRFGIGSALTEQVLTAARAEGLAAMEIWSDKRFGDAHRLYGRFGARQIGDRVCDDPDQSPEWGLVIDLNEVGTPDSA
jgi:putative acetyltransferase